MENSINAQQLAKALLWLSNHAKKMHYAIRMQSTSQDEIDDLDNSIKFAVDTLKRYSQTLSSYEKI